MAGRQPPSAGMIAADAPAGHAPGPAAAAAPTAASPLTRLARKFGPGLGDRSFRTNTLVALLCLVLLTGGALIWIADRNARSTASALAGQLFREASEHAVTRSRGFVDRAEPLVESLAAVAGNGIDLDDSDRLAAQLSSVLRANPGVSWLSYGDEDGDFTGAYRTSAGAFRVNQSRIVDGRTRLVEHDVQPDGAWSLHRRHEDTDYDPRGRPFYFEAKQARGLVWLAPYVFFDQAVPGVSCAKPVYGPGGRLRGVFSADFDLNALSAFVSGLSVSEHSEFFLFTTDGTLLAHPRTRAVRVEGQGAEGKLLTLKDVDDPLVQAYRRSMPAGAADAGAEPGFRLFTVTHGGERYMASATPFRVGSGDDAGGRVWVVGAVSPEDDFLGPARRSRLVSMSVAGAALVGAMLLAALLAARVSGPVARLVEFMGRVGDGELDARLEPAGSREFRRASGALNRMIDGLRDRLRMRHSLNVAMEVQQRLLPSRPPVVDGLDLAGHSTYCDETGGDYYDYLVLDQPASSGALVALGDVMGHGVSAALVMAGVRAVLRSRIAVDGNLAKMTATLNRLLCEDLGGERFMTMHLSFVDLKSRVYRWCSAGHDPALIWDPRRRVFDEIDAGDLPLGVEEDTTYNEASYPLGGGEVIVIGTDGIWEATNKAGEQFGKDRLKEAVFAAVDRPAADIVDEIVRRLTAFRDGCRRDDDVTLVVIKVLPFDAGFGGGRITGTGDEI